jgi:NAD(P)-dependent dehydrogenase (short-subunit alcohol dehydrogenase family)
MYNPFSLENKTILVTGASSGIGRAIAIECSKMGASVIITGRNEERLKETYSQMNHHGNHIIIKADLKFNEQIDELANQINYELDGIVQCAGFTIPKPFKFYSEKDIQSVMKVNFEAPFYLTQALLKNKKIKNKASIVFISSISGVYVSYVGGSLYSASKGALNGLCKGIAIELAPKGIRVNCVNPGMISTDILSDGTISAEQLDEDAKRYPLKRYGKPEEVAYAVIYLLSDAAEWITGSNLLIDGGYTLL